MTNNHLESKQQCKHLKAESVQRITLKKLFFRVCHLISVRTFWIWKGQVPKKGYIMHIVVVGKSGVNMIKINIHTCIPWFNIWFSNQFHWGQSWAPHCQLSSIGIMVLGRLCSLAQILSFHWMSNWIRPTCTGILYCLVRKEYVHNDSLETPLFHQCHIDTTFTNSSIPLQYKIQLVLPINCYQFSAVLKCIHVNECDGKWGADANRSASCCCGK